MGALGCNPSPGDKDVPEAEAGEDVSCGDHGHLTVAGN